MAAGKLGWPDSDRDMWLSAERAGAGRGKVKVKDTGEDKDGEVGGFGLKAEKQEQPAKGKGKGKRREAEMGNWSEGLEDADYTKLLEDGGEEAGAPSPTPRIGRGTVIAVDLLRMDPLPGVRTLQMDFLTPEANACIAELLCEPSVSAVTAALEEPGGAGVDGGVLEGERGDGKADVILSDMAANFTGNTTADVEASLEICKSVFKFVRRHLRSAESVGRSWGGALVYVFPPSFACAVYAMLTCVAAGRLKHFAHPAADGFRRKILNPNFNKVVFVKPPSSRAESREGYWVCLGWKGTPAYRKSISRRSASRR